MKQQTFIDTVRPYYPHVLARRKGWPYVLAWAHRVSGVFLALYVGLHIATLASLDDPAAFAAKMASYSSLVPGFLEWLLGVPVIFHALNGGRLLLYELFGVHREQRIISWMLGLSGLYLLLLATSMALGNQNVSAVFFWLYLFVASSCLTYLCLGRLKKTRASYCWKLHRIGAAFLLLMIPAHMLFMHLNPEIGRNAQVILARMDNGFIKSVELLLVAGVLYHCAYGLINIGRDYWETTLLRRLYTGVISALALVFGWVGVALIVSV